VRALVVGAGAIAGFTRRSSPGSRPGYGLMRENRPRFTLDSKRARNWKHWKQPRIYLPND